MRNGSLASPPPAAAACAPFEAMPRVRRARRGWEGLRDRSTWLTTFHLLLDLPIGITTFTVIVTGVSLTLGLAVTFPLALPVAWATLGLGRAMATMERGRAAALLEEHVAAPTRPDRAGLGWLRRLQRYATQRSTWTEMAYHLVLLPIGCLTFSLTVLIWSLPLAALSVPLVVAGRPGHELSLGPWHASWMTASFTALGVALLLLAEIPVAIAALGDLDAVLVRALLGRNRSDDLTDRVQTLETSRSALVDAVDAERRRIERDLHDGAQQRLVAVALDLGMAREKLAHDEAVPSDVRDLLESAHTEAKRAITELRDVARGVHPAILEDRGLDAALSSLAARCPVPVDVAVDVAVRPPRAVEAVAYYVVAEALTNVAKHAEASKVQVRVSRTGDRLGIDVTDDGRGGAVIGNGGGLGGGLAGLRDRVRSIDGELFVISPVGGPTTVLVELPCGS